MLTHKRKLVALLVCLFVLVGCYMSSVLAPVLGVSFGAMATAVVSLFGVYCAGNVGAHLAGSTKKLPPTVSTEE
jgi:Flp pilus assembly protein protease CpaA